MKALIDDCKEIDLFPPGHFYTPETGLVRWFNPVWWDENRLVQGSSYPYPYPYSCPYPTLTPTLPLTLTLSVPLPFNSLPISAPFPYTDLGAPDLVRLRAVFEQAVVRRMMAEVPYGVLLSGGLDSSLVAAIAARKYREIKNGAKILSFSIGLEARSTLTPTPSSSSLSHLVHLLL